MKVRTLLIAAALLAATVAAPATAQAAPESAPAVARTAQNLDGRFTAPGAPHITRPPADRATAAAVSPTISPSANYFFIPPNSDYQCYSGNLCTGVWDPTRSQWKIFKLYYCNFYTLYNWLGDGFYVNNQTDGTTAYFYNSSRQVIKSAPADHEQHPYDWDPVYYIRNC
jgi:hypothetical protein